MAHRRKKGTPHEHVVYMYFNEVTEMCYVGAAAYGLENRHASHMEETKDITKHSKFVNALREWPECCWSRIVLEECDRIEDLEGAETKWIELCCACENGVGYNTYRKSNHKAVTAGGNTMKRKKFTQKERAVLAVSGQIGGLIAIGVEPTAEEIEKRNKKRAEKKERSEKWKNMTDEEKSAFFKESGKKGAIASGAKPSKKTLEERTQKQWYQSLNDEEKRQWHVECGRSNKKTATEIIKAKIATQNISRKIS